MYKNTGLGLGLSSFLRLVFYMKTISIPLNVVQSRKARKMKDWKLYCASTTAYARKITFYLRFRLLLVSTVTGCSRNLGYGQVMRAE